MIENYDGIICPHCIEVDEDSWEYAMKDGDETVINCPHCDKKMRVECSITVMYSSEKFED